MKSSYSCVLIIAIRKGTKKQRDGKTFGSFSLMGKNSERVQMKRSEKSPSKETDSSGLPLFLSTEWHELDFGAIEKKERKSLFIQLKMIYLHLR
ncbi:MAG: hypothetical protein RR206_06340 [Bacteroidaceae bacterium]